MNTIFKYNANAKYSTKDLLGGHNSKNFSLLDVYLDEKGPSVKIQMPSTFKDHHIVAKPIPTTVDYDEWPLSIALWRKFYNSHGKYKSELNQCFHMYRCQLNFALFCVTSALGISWQHLNHLNLLVRSVYRFHVYFHVRLIFHDLGIFYHMKMVSARLKILTLRAQITVSVMTMALIRMKNGCMETGFIQLVMVFLVMK